MSGKVNGDNSVHFRFYAYTVYIFCIAKAADRQAFKVYAPTFVESVYQISSSEIY